MHNYPSSLYGWMSNNLRQRTFLTGSFIYQEGDLIHDIHFLTKGRVGYALPRKGAFFILVEPGDTFGIVDLTYEIQRNVTEELLEVIQPPFETKFLDQCFEERLWDWDLTNKRLYRYFSVQVIEDPHCEFQYLSLFQLKALRNDFPEVFKDLFKSSKFEVQATIRAKNRGLDLLKEIDPPLKAL